VNQSHLALINENYINGFPLYQSVEGSVITAASFSNGCGPRDPNEKLAIIVKWLLEHEPGKRQAELFRPVCNAHDVCYSCGLTESDREDCDRYMYENMINICVKKYPESMYIAGDLPTVIDRMKDKLHSLLEVDLVLAKEIMYGTLNSYIYYPLGLSEQNNDIRDGDECLYWAEIFAAAVSKGGEEAFNDKLFDPSKDCAKCGNPNISNSLFREPFYIKECCLPKDEISEEITQIKCKYEEYDGICKHFDDCKGVPLDVPGLCPENIDNNPYGGNVYCCISEKEEIIPINTPCFDRGGQCMNPDKCDGTVENDLCSGNENNICCLPKKECKYDGLTGVCKNVNDCDGFSQPDLCDGGKDNQCCIPIKECENDDGIKGQCLPEDQCNSGNTVIGKCEGGNSIKCCLPTKEPDDRECTNLGGQCMNPNNCDGTVENDLCSGNENNKCCLPKKECKYDGLTGVCKNVNDCDGFSQPDLCDGGKDNQCCIPIKECENDDGIKGQCLPEDQCSSGNTVIGKCEGGNSIKCCLPETKYKCSYEGVEGYEGLEGLEGVCVMSAEDCDTGLIINSDIFEAGCPHSYGYTFSGVSFGYNSGGCCLPKVKCEYERVEGHCSNQECDGGKSILGTDLCPDYYGMKCCLPEKKDDFCTKLFQSNISLDSECSKSSLPLICNEFLKLNYSKTEICTLMTSLSINPFYYFNCNSSRDDDRKYGSYFCSYIFKHNSHIIDENGNEILNIEEGCDKDMIKNMCNEFVRVKYTEYKICEILFTSDHNKQECINIANGTDVPGVGERCRDIAGTCIDTTIDSCSTKIESNHCGGGDDVRCCLDPKEGVGERCRDVAGTCIDTTIDSCSTKIESNHCGGGDDVRCCLDPKEGVGERCRDVAGTCIDTTIDSCSTKIESNHCGGGDDVRCCLDPKEGVGERCRDVAGTCIDTTIDSCSTKIESNHCGGGDDVRCCLDPKEGVGERCRDIAGTCIDTTIDSCPTKIESNHCGGGDDVRCCLDPKEGVGERCRDVAGTCIDTTIDSCPTKIESNHCGGGDDVRCCLDPKEGVGERCRDIAGTCIDTTIDSCPTKIESNHCGGGDDVRCCLDDDNNQSNHGDDSECLNRYGTCISTGDCIIGDKVGLLDNYNSDLCPGYANNIKCCIPYYKPEETSNSELLTGSTKSSISNLKDAISHYRGKSGKTVPASETLIYNIKNSNSYKNMISELKDGIKDKITATKIENGEKISATEGSSRGLKDDESTLGSFNVNIDYSFIPKYGPNTFTIYFWGYNTWDFEHNDNYKKWENLIKEDIPGLISDFGLIDITSDTKLGITYSYGGTPYDITYSFSDVITVTY